jgi:hypothetical protein
LAQSDGHDAPGLLNELVPSVTAMVDEIVVGIEDAVREPIVALMFVVNDFGRVCAVPLQKWGKEG